MKKNCWEVRGCGRQIGGAHVHDLGLCPAATQRHLDGVHGGQNAGRACWVVAGTLGEGGGQATFAQRFKNCQECDFYKQVLREEAGTFKMSIMLLAQIKESEA